jgi:hypothetical protein
MTTHHTTHHTTHEITVTVSYLSRRRMFRARCTCGWESSIRTANRDRAIELGAAHVERREVGK